MSAAPVLRAVGLHRFFHTADTEVAALLDVSVDILAGEMVAVVGPSGSGKSTLLACLAGLDEPDGGMVELEGEPLSRRSERDRARRRATSIGLLLERSNLFSHLDLEGNLRFGQALAGRDDADRRHQVLEQLRLTGRRRARPGQLSGGESVRAGLAVALVNDPPVLLADEPTGEVDAATEERILDQLREVAGAGTAVVVVTHSAVVAGAADRTVELRDGRRVVDR